MRTRELVVLVVLVVLASALFSAAPATAARQNVKLDGQVRSVSFSKAVPGQLNYQGYLVDAVDSVAVNATLGMTFRLFDLETKGAELWSETHPAVDVSNGLFQVLLGSVTVFPAGLFDGTTLWLQTEVGAEVLSPRKPLVSVAYSNRAELADNAERLEGATLTGLDARWVNEDQPNSVTSAMIADGEIVDDDVAAGAAIDPGKIAGTAWTADNDGAGSGLDADLLDGQQAADFISMDDLDHLDAADGDPANAVYVDDAGKVGVGTTSPLTELDVNGSVNATTYYGDGSNLTGIAGAPDADWTISGSDMYSAVSGNVGIGITTPSVKLHVVGSTGNYSTIATISYGVYGRNVGGDNYGYLGSSSYGVYGKNNGSGNYGYLGSGSYGVYGYSSSPKAGRGLPTGSNAVYGEAKGSGASGVYGLHTDTGNFGVLGHPEYAGFFGGGVYIRDSLGIGTTTPLGQLHVHGDWPQIHLSNNVNSNWFTVSTGYLGISFDSDFGTEPFCVDYSAPDGALTINSNGGCMLGSFSAPQAGLEIYSDINDYELWLTEEGTTWNDHAQICFDADSADYDIGNNSGTGVFYIFSPGYGDAIDISGSEAWIWLNYDTYVGGDLDVSGNFTVTGTKSFVQEDPTDPSKAIVYACLEGPEAGTYQRGTGRLVGGRATIELPDHFAKVTANDDLTIHLTPVGQWLQLYVVEKSPSRIVVAEASGHDGAFDYLVQGIRKGYEDYQVVRDRSEIPGMDRRKGERMIQGGPPGTASVIPPAAPAEKGNGNFRRNVTR
ncbi:hypothetical protein KAX22_03185 [bacterium]|nr:hypothetical protein [bacterium]